MTPRVITNAARLVLAFAAGTTTRLVLLAPTAGQTLDASHLIRIALFYGLTGLLYTAAPRLRRADLTLAAVTFGAALEVARIALGRGADPVALGADALGAAAVLAPMYVERARDLTRRRDHEPFSAIRDRRVETVRTASPLHASAPARGPATGSASVVDSHRAAA